MNDLGVFGQLGSVVTPAPLSAAERTVEAPAPTCPMTTDGQSLLQTDGAEPRRAPAAPSSVRYLRPTFHDASGRFGFLDGKTFIYRRMSPYTGRVLIDFGPMPDFPSLENYWPAEPVEVFHDGNGGEVRS